MGKKSLKEAVLNLSVHEIIIVNAFGLNLT